MVKLLLIILLLSFGLSSQGNGTGYVLPNTKEHNLGTKHNYQLYVSYPRGYMKDGKVYPVIYLLDPDYSFAIANNIVNHFSDRDNLPESIIVGLGYDIDPFDRDAYKNNRTRDYTPTKSVRNDHYTNESFQMAGGADKFISDIEHIIFPFMEKHYNVGSRTIVGHSFGGLIGSYILFTKPYLFSNYIILSPSLWYDDKMIFDVETKFSQQSKTLDVDVFFGIGSEENKHHKMVTDLQHFLKNINKHQYEKLTVELTIFDSETHNSVFPAAFTRAITKVLKH